jgi:catalase
VLPAPQGSEAPWTRWTGCPENFFAENEQIAFGTGVLVDGLDFSDDKMLVGRTFTTATPSATASGRTTCSCRERGQTRVATNQRDGQMAYAVDLARGRTRTSTTSRHLAD